ncbi:hypothetical protein Tco_1343017 [Tanacetum coccineum]
MVASISVWSMRESKKDIDVYEAYATQESLFSLKVNYDGFFTESPGRSYVNGEFAYFDCIVIDEFSIHELNDMPDMSLDNGLYALGNEAYVRD